MQWAPFLFAATLAAQPAVQTQLFHPELPFSGSVNAVAADPSGSIFAAGYYAQGAFVAKFDSKFHQVFLTVLPGDIANAAALAIDRFGDAYVAGTTTANRFAAGTPNLLGCAQNCSTDAYVVKVNGATGEVAFVSYLGGQFADSGTAVAVGSDRSIYLAGSTTSLDFPLTTGALVDMRPAAPAGFVARISADGKALLSSTYWNGAPLAMALRGSGEVVLTGTTSADAPGTPGAYQLSPRYVNLMASADNGATWSNLATPTRVIWVEPDPKRAGVVYAATFAGLLRSTNGGATWSSIGPFAEALVIQVRVDPTASNTIYATAVTEPAKVEALWKSADGGDTWTKLSNLGNSDTNLQINRARPSTLYLMYLPHNETIISRDGGSSWSSPPLPNLSGFTVDAADGNVVYAGSSRSLSLYRSLDAGQHWDSIDDPFRNPFSNVGSIPLFASGPAILHTSLLFFAMAGGVTYSNGARRSRDGGKTWSDVPGVPATAGFADPNHAKRIFIVGAAGLFTSADAGDTWQALRGGTDNPNVTQVAAGGDGTWYAVATPQPGAFVGEVDAGLGRIAYYTCYGDTGGVTPTSLAIDAQGRVVIAGTTTSRALPVTVGQRAIAGYGDGFVARFSAGGSRLDFATFLGGTATDTLQAVATGADGEIYVTGSTTSADFPATSGALQKQYRASVVAGYLSVLGPEGAVRYSSFLGGALSDGMHAAVVAGGKLYLGASVASPDFPGVDPAAAPQQPVAALVQVDLAALTLGPPPGRRHIQPGAPTRRPRLKRVVH